MKKLIAGSTAIIIALIFISWGFTGHRTIGQIADNQQQKSKNGKTMPRSAICIPFFIKQILTPAKL
jgi:hypothetical protein